MKNIALLFVFAALTIAGSAAVAQPDWLAQIGLGNNTYPGGGNDPYNYFGAYTGEIDDYLGVWDTVNPTPGDHTLDLLFRGDQTGDNPTYPEAGLMWDIREPWDPFGAGPDVKVWKIEVLLPDEGEEADILFHYAPFVGYELPAGWQCKLDTDGEINAGNYMDFSLYEYDLNHLGGTPGDPKDYVVIDTIAQIGGTETWYLVAGIPEPAFAQLAGLLVGVAGIGFVRFRK